jgi:serine/threonine-protein kinase
MLDGQGKVRITDFGLAGLEDSIRGDDVRSGTPAYMSPEQLTGREVSARSDVYSLGLVLYELFTGKKAFEGKTFAEMLRKHRDERPPDPSSVVPSLDPAVEGTILRCIAKDPAARPVSALGVAALLPGGDPLAAALAAGITPSPEMVAAAGEAEGLSRSVAGACLAVVLAGVFLAPLLVGPFQLHNRVPVEKPAAVLEDRARELVKRLTGGEDPADSSLGFDWDETYLRHLRERDDSPRRWDSLARGDPPVVRFYYRQSVHPLVSTSVTGRVSWNNPPIGLLSGNAGARLDMRGRLVSFYSVPPQLESEGASQAAPDWAPLLEETGLVASSLRPVPPRWTPPFYVDSRVAWEGVYPEQPGLTVRVEAAAYRGRPAAFYVVGPWTRPERMQPRDLSRRQLWGIVSGLVLLVTLLVTGAVLAKRNLALGRGDRRGALRIAGYVFAVLMTGWGAFNADHVADLTGEWTILMRGTGFALFVASVIWLFYVALEPYVRRLRPQTLISWTRILSGDLRHPIVGRDLLVGAVWGASCAILIPAAHRLVAGLGFPPAEPLPSYLDVLLAPRYLVGYLIGTQVDGIVLGLGALLLFVVLRLVLRHDLAAAIVLVLVLTAFRAVNGWEANPWLRVCLSLLLMTTYVVILLRLGLLAVISATYVSDLLTALPLTTRLGTWLSGPTVTAGVIVIALAVYAFRTATRVGRPRVKASAVA